MHGSQIFYLGCMTSRSQFIDDYLNRKSTIDEGFFDFFLDLEAKKKCLAGEAIEGKYI